MNISDLMEKTALVGIIVVVIVVIAIGIYFLYGKGNLNTFVGGGASTTVKANVSVNATTSAIVQSTAQTTTPQNTTLSDCLSNSPIVNLYNGNFSTGTYAGWNVTGLGFGSTPANITKYNDNNEYYNSPWTGYNGNFFATTYQGGFIISPGNLTSDTFQVTEPYLNFQIISPQSNLLYVEILSNGVPVITKQFDTYGSSGSPSSNFKNASISLTSLLCKYVSVRVVSGVVYTPATKYDIIAAGDFYLAKAPIQSPGISTG